MQYELDYDHMVMLDAEDLAEGGIAEAYESLLPRLRQYLAQPDSIQEMKDPTIPRYAVRFRGREYLIYGPGLPTAADAWGPAAYALFTIVNEQLEGSPYRLFALNDGNDLGGMFLTISQAEAARDALPRRRDWPYLPTDEPPWYGEYH